MKKCIHNKRKMNQKIFKKIAPKKGKRPSQEKDESEQLETSKDGKKLQDKEDDIKIMRKKSN